jgi:short-subunit dehydrogenase
VIAADLEKEAGLARVEKVLSTNPAVRVFVNNPGSARLRTGAQSPLGDSPSQIALDITAVTCLTRAILPAFLSRNDGVTIKAASVLALHSLPISSVYSGTKGFVR